MVVQVAFEAVSVYVQAHRMDLAVPLLEELRNPANEELRQGILEDVDDEDLVQLH